jgi:hypothetical protein
MLENALKLQLNLGIGSVTKKIVVAVNCCVDGFVKPPKLGCPLQPRSSPCVGL